MSHTAELEELDRKIADLDDQFAEGNVPAKAYGRMMERLGARRDELAALPQRAAEVRYEHDDDSPTVRDHGASLTTEDRARSCLSGGCRSSQRARRARSATSGGRLGIPGRDRQ